MAHPADTLQQLLALRWPPLAIAFDHEPPSGVSRVASAAPSGCTYWKLAAEGRVFYTEAADHHHCPVGSYTHGIELPPERRDELEGLIGTMVELRYLREEEISAIPHRSERFGVAVYAPWSRAPCEPDVVVVRGNARQMMLLTEASRAAGVEGGGALMGRPSCAAVAAVLQSGRAAASLGCIGNRVYTELADDELYAVLPGRLAAEVVERLATIVEANRQLEAFHRQRQAAAVPVRG